MPPAVLHQLRVPAARFALGDVEPLAARTLVAITQGHASAPACVRTLAVVEVLLGLVMFFAPIRKPLGRILLRWTLVATVLQLCGTFLPFVLFPHETWKHPFVLTFAGQYIVKNIALLSAAVVVGAEVFGAEANASQRSGSNPAHRPS